MKKYVIILVTLILVIVIGVGCSSKEKSKTEEELRAEIKAELEEEMDATNNSDDSNSAEAETGLVIDIDEKLTDMEAIAEYLDNNELFNMAYYEAQGSDFNYENYVMNHIDFTGDGNLDTIIVTWIYETDYNVVVFMSLEDGEYVTYMTDLRASKDSTFYMEDGFIVEESNDYADLAYLIPEPEAYLILKTGASYQIESTEEVPTLIPGTFYEITNSINKLNGLDEFEAVNILNYIDESGNSHLVRDYRYSFKFDADVVSHDYREDYNVDNDIAQIMADNLIMGNSSNLDTFQDVISETEDLTQAIDYYMENRKDFSKSSRQIYLADALAFISDLDYIEFMMDDEYTNNQGIEKVTIWNANPVPESARSIFKVVKKYYIEDGGAFDVQRTKAEGWYALTCVDEDYTEMIRVMKADRALLSGEGIDYISNEDEYVDQHFTNEADLYALTETVVYPVVLIDSFDQLDSFKDQSIWKVTAVIIPNNVEFLDSYEGGETDSLFEYQSETVYSMDNEFYIDYSTYTLVIIPQQESINTLNEQDIYVTDTGNETTLMFKVFGTLTDMVLTYTVNGLDSSVEPTVIEVGDISNSTVYVHVDLPTDFSRVDVIGFANGDYDGDYIEFSLDDMRDATSYEIITREY